MTRFAYQARNERGGLVKGEIEGESVQEAAREIGQIGYVPVRIRKSSNSGPGFHFLFEKKVKPDDMILFTKQFQTLVRTGVPLVRGLQSLRDQNEKKEMREVISLLLKDIQEGTSLYEAMKKQPDVFTPVYRNTIKAGETAGRLDEVLDKLSGLLEYEQKVKEEIKSAMRYPVMVIIVMSLAFFVLVTYVLPKFMTIFARFDMELPLPTRILMGVSHFFHNYWYINLILVAGITVGIRLLLRTDGGMRTRDMLKLKLPAVGRITLKGIMSRFAKILAILTGSGVPILEALDVVGEAVGNKIIAGWIGGVRERVMGGTGLSVPMNQEGTFPPLLVQMVSIGEETGAMEEMLNEAAHHYEMEIDYHLKRLTAAIEPILLVGLGGMMLLLALGVFMPLWNMVGIAQR